MEIRKYAPLQETALWKTLPNGLTVVIVPRPGFQRKLCYFATDFGSIHTQFTLDGKHYTVPAGIAHYLEHKLFDMPGRDVAAEFAALGASVNAFTSYDMTAYHFTCTDHFDACLSLLLDFVSTPYFTEESVQKEQGIIGQEIGMNEDSPDTKIFELLMEGMYRNHTVRQPILGTRESISRITPQTLALCHRAFYRPDNMLLCIVGDVDAQQVYKTVNAHIPAPEGEKAQPKRCWQEHMTCPCAFVKREMEVAMPMFQLGFKCQPLERGADAIRGELIGDLAAEALFGESSALYLKLYEEGMIDASFGGGFETVEGMALLSLSGDSMDPEAVKNAVLEEAKLLLQRGLTEESLLRMKRSALGRRIRALDSFDSICFRLCAYYFSGFDYFDFPAIYQEITPAQILDFIQKTVTPDNLCLSVIFPKEDSQ